MNIKRALISVYDKKNLVPFARALRRLGVEMISTGGTARLLRGEGIPVKGVSELTHYSEMLDGRVKTLHPAVHAGLLAVRDDPAHMKTLRAHRIQPIDLLVVNLYPFAQAVGAKKSPSQILERIDIGGPALLRSASKNFKYVAAVSDPADYPAVLKEIQKAGTLSEATRKRLAAKTFRLTSAYDRLIGNYLEDAQPSSPWPLCLTLEFEKAQDLRYGENPHQRGALYRERGSKPTGVSGARKLHGRELSFNNLLDLDAAFDIVRAFAEPSCVIIKHANPCGFAIAKTLEEAFQRACACDPMSAFGGVIGFNRRLDKKTADRILRSGFIECILAEGFARDALKLLVAKKNLRLVEVAKNRGSGGWDFKKIVGGLLLQERDTQDPRAEQLRCVTQKTPTPSQVRDLLWAFKLCRWVKSNAIVVAKNGRTLGIGMGQPSRVEACRIAVEKAGHRARGAVLASDGFFPKPDSIEVARRARLAAIIQPGGSLQDREVIQACDRAKIAMVFTGIRHFRH